MIISFFWTDDIFILADIHSGQQMTHVTVENSWILGVLLMHLTKKAYLLHEPLLCNTDITKLDF